MAAGTLKAKQITASGLIVGKRALFKQLLVFSPVANDSVIEFYDQTRSEEHTSELQSH